MTPERERLYYAAIEADEAFQRELVRVYGKLLATEKRYQVRLYDDPALNAAKDRKRAADDAQRAG